jgi:predicted nucleic acid-binding protein
VTRVLIDTSVWIAHFRRADPVLQLLLMLDQALCHPCIVLELACGTPPAPRARSLRDLQALQQGVVATNDEVLALIERERLYDDGCGAIDMALLASTLLTPGATLWTLDQKLKVLAVRLGVAFSAAHH